MSEWRKSSYSSYNGNCVEAAADWHKSSYSYQGNCVEVGWHKAAASNPHGSCVEVGTARKSSYSDGSAHCVEAGPCACGGDVLVRDTKDRDGGTLEFSREAWGRFVAAVKTGEL